MVGIIDANRICTIVKLSSAMIEVKPKDMFLFRAPDAA